MSEGGEQTEREGERTRRAAPVASMLVEYLAESQRVHFSELLQSVQVLSKGSEGEHQLVDDEGLQHRVSKEGEHMYDAHLVETLERLGSNVQFVALPAMRHMLAMLLWRILEGTSEAGRPISSRTAAPSSGRRSLLARAAFLARSQRPCRSACQLEWGGPLQETHPSPPHPVLQPAAEPPDRRNE